MVRELTIEQELGFSPPPPQNLADVYALEPGEKRRLLNSFGPGVTTTWLENLTGLPTIEPGFLADFLHQMGGTREDFSRHFEPESFETLTQSGLMPPDTTTLTSGSPMAPTPAPPMASPTPTPSPTPSPMTAPTPTPLPSPSPPSFSSSFTGVGYDQKIEEDLSQVDPVPEDSQFLITGLLSAVGGLGEAIMNPTSNSDTAPALLRQDGMGYIQEGGDSELRKAEEAWANQDFGGMVQHFFGARMAMAGRAIESMTAEMQGVAGQNAAYMLLFALEHAGDRPVTGSLYSAIANSSHLTKDLTFEDLWTASQRNDYIAGASLAQMTEWKREKFEMDMFELRTIANGTASIETMRAFWNSLAKAWPSGAKGLVEGMIPLALDMALPAPPIHLLGRLFPTTAATRAAKAALSSGRRGVDNATRFRVMKRDLLENLGDPDVAELVANARNIDDLPGAVKNQARRILAKIPVDVSVKSPKEVIAKVFKLPPEQQIFEFENNARDVAKDIINSMGAGGDPVKAVKFLSRVSRANGLGDLEWLFHANPQLRINFAARETLETLIKGGNEGGKYANMRKFMVRPPVINGVKTEWSTQQVISEWVQQTTHIVNDFVIHSRGPSLFKDGSMGPIQSAFTEFKPYLVDSWLLARFSFLALQVKGAVALASQKYGPELFSYFPRKNWLNKVNTQISGYGPYVASDPANVGRKFVPDRLLGHQAETSGLGVGQEAGFRIPGTHKPLHRYLPIFGDQFLPTSLLRAGLVGAGAKGRKFRIALGAPNAEEISQVKGGLAAMQKAVTSLESAQHSVIQTIDFHKVAMSEINLRTKSIEGIPPKFQRLYMNEIKKGGEVFNTIGRREFAFNYFTREGLGNTISRVDDLTPDLNNARAEQFLRSRLAGLDPKTTNRDQIAKAFEDAAKDYNAEALDDIRKLYEANPEQPGLRVYELLRIYKETGAPINADTRRILSAMGQHEDEIVSMEKHIMDVLGSRMQAVHTSDAIKEIVGVKMQAMQEGFAKLRREKSVKTVARLAEYRKRLSNSPKGVKGEAARKEAGAWWQAADDAHQQEAAQAYDVFLDTAEKDLMIIALNKTALAKTTPRARITAYTADVDYDDLESTIPGIIRNQRDVIREITERVQPVNLAFVKARTQAQKMAYGVAERDAIANARHAEVRKIYWEVANKHNIDLPDMNYKYGIDEESVLAIVKGIDLKRGDGLATHMNDATSYADMIMLHVDEVKRAMFNAQDETIRMWEAPIVPSDLPFDLAELTRIQNEAFTIARSSAASKSAELLFTYRYNNLDTQLNMVFPFSYWAYKYIILQARHAMDNPGQFKVFMEMMLAWYDETKDLPPHLQFTIRILTLADGTEIRIDPFQMILPFGGGRDAFSLVGLGREDRGDNRSLLSGAFDALSMLGLGQLHPFFTIVGEAAKGLIRPDESEEKFSPETKEVAGQFFGSVENLLNSIGGGVQRIFKSHAAQGNLPFIDPAFMYEHGLTEGERRNIGYQIVDYFRKEEIPIEDAMQAIMDVQSKTPNELAMRAMMDVYQQKNAYVNVPNWWISGIRNFSESWRTSREVNKQYWQLIEDGYKDEAAKFLKDNPWIPLSWMVNDDREAQEEKLENTRVFTALDRANDWRDDQLERVDITDVQATQEIYEQYKAKVNEITGQYRELTNKEVDMSDRGGRVSAGERKDHIKKLAQQLRDLIPYEDHVNDEGYFDAETYYGFQDDFIKAEVDLKYQEDFRNYLLRNKSRQDAVLHTYGELYINQYLSDTENMSSSDKDQYFLENPLPSDMDLAQEVLKIYNPNRDPNKQFNIDDILSDIKKLTIQGYFDIRSGRDIERVKHSSVTEPFAFKAPSGKLVTKANLDEFLIAKTQHAQWIEASEERSRLKWVRTSLYAERNAALSALTVTEQLTGEADPIWNSYRQSKILVDANEAAALKSGALIKWTEGMDKWFSPPDQVITLADGTKINTAVRDTKLANFAEMYHGVTPSQFPADNDPEDTDWSSYYEAKDAMRRSVLEAGRKDGISRDEINEKLFGGRVPTDLVAQWWRKIYLSEGIDAWFNLEPGVTYNRIYVNKMLAAYEQKATYYGRGDPPTVAHVRDQLEEEFPWISSQQWDAIEDQSLPSLAEYVNAREWKVPIY